MQIWLRFTHTEVNKMCKIYTAVDALRRGLYMKDLLSRIPVHIRNGAVIIIKLPKLLVDTTYATPYNVIIALNEKGHAFGRLYIDDRYSVQPALMSNINFIFTGNTLTINGQFGYRDNESLEYITILSDKNITYSSATIKDKTFKVMTNGTTAY